MLDLADLGKELRQLGADLLEDLEDAEKRSLDDLEEECHAASRGTLTRREIARIRPYSRKRGARLNPDIVNRHTREFDEGWRQDGPKLKRGGLESEVFNVSRTADFFDKGTDTMVPRHPENRAADIIEPRRIERLERVLDKHTE